MWRGSLRFEPAQGGLRDHESEAFKWTMRRATERVLGANGVGGNSCRSRRVAETVDPPRIEALSETMGSQTLTFGPESGRSLCRPIDPGGEMVAPCPRSEFGYLGFYGSAADAFSGFCPPPRFPIRRTVLGAVRHLFQYRGSAKPRARLNALALTILTEQRSSEYTNGLWVFCRLKSPAVKTDSLLALKWNPSASVGNRHASNDSGLTRSKVGNFMAAKSFAFQLS